MENITPPMAAKTASSALDVTGAKGDARLAVDLAHIGDNDSRTGPTPSHPAWWSELRFRAYPNGKFDAYSPDGKLYLNGDGRWQIAGCGMEMSRHGVFFDRQGRLSALRLAKHWNGVPPATQKFAGGYAVDEPNPYVTPVPVEPELNDGMPPAAGKCPQCGSGEPDYCYEEKHGADHEVGIRAWRGGMVCNSCAYHEPRGEPGYDGPDDNPERLGDA